MVSLLDLLNSCSHLHCSVLTGFEGLSREIKTITSLESPKSVEMLKEGSFVLSSGVLFEGKNIDQLYIFVEQLIKQGSVALGIKTRFIKAVPESVIELAGINGFTLLLLPNDCLWSELFSTFYQMSEHDNTRIIDANESNVGELYRLGNIQTHLIYQKYIEIIRIGAVITDSNYRILAQNDKPGVDRIMDFLADINKRGSSFIGSIDTIGSFRSFLHKDLRITDIVLVKNAHLILSHAKRNLSLDEIELLQMNYNNLFNVGRSTEDTNGVLERAVEQVLDGLINNNQIVNLNGLISSTEFKEAKCMILYYIGDDVKAFIEAFTEQLRKQIAFKGIRFFYSKTNTENEYIVLYLRKIADAIDVPDNYFFNTLSNLKLEEDNSKIFIGNPVMFVGDILSSFKQASICKRYGETLWKSKRILFYRDIECLAFLEDSEISVKEIADLDQSIITFDAIETLEAALENKSVKQAADACFVHENTMRYRLSKIQNVLNADINSSVVSLNLLIKIKLYKLTRASAL